jgi:hypothetical protein
MLDLYSLVEHIFWLTFIKRWILFYKMYIICFIEDNEMPIQQWKKKNFITEYFGKFYVTIKK